MGLELMLQYFQSLKSDAEREPFANQIAAVFCSMAEVYLTDLWYVQFASCVYAGTNVGKPCAERRDRVLAASRHGPQVCTQQPRAPAAPVQPAHQSEAERRSARRTATEVRLWTCCMLSSLTYNSMALWHNKEDGELPSYDFRITTGQLLIELGQHLPATEVLSQLTQEVRLCTHLSCKALTSAQ